MASSIKIEETRILGVNLQQDTDPQSQTFGQWFVWVRYEESHAGGLTAGGTAHMTSKAWQRSINNMIEQTLAGEGKAMPWDAALKPKTVRRAAVKRKAK